MSKTAAVLNEPPLEVEADGPKYWAEIPTGDGGHVSTAQCYLCRRMFGFGRHVFEGKYLKDWDMTVCIKCIHSGQGGISPAQFPHLVERLRSRGIAARRNDKQFICLPG